MASTIGIKIANGKFFPVIEEQSPAVSLKKRLVLTTVRDSQGSMQIDLYRNRTSALAGDQYIGSIVVKDIKPKPKGEPSVELIISLGEDGILAASAIDMDAPDKGGYQHLDVSLKSLDIDGQEHRTPDYRMEQTEPPPAGLYEKALRIQEQEEGKKKFPWHIVIIIGLVFLLIVLGGLCAWFFLLRDDPASAEPSSRPVVEQPAVAPEPVPAPVVEAAPEPPPPPEPVSTPVMEAVPEPPPVPVIEPVKPVEDAPVVSRERRSTAPVSSYKVPAVIPKGGVAYRIRWGDTLWDISEAFYRNPWLYRRIARYNGIRNPDRIISGTTIRIPPKN
jgi:outer membrane biosynthesis protein TonB